MNRFQARQIRRGIIAARSAAAASRERREVPRRHSVDRLSITAIDAYTTYVRRHMGEWPRS